MSFTPPRQKPLNAIGVMERNVKCHYCIFSLLPSKARSNFFLSTFIFLILHLINHNVTVNITAGQAAPSRHPYASKNIF